MYAFPAWRPLRTPNGLKWSMYAFYAYFAVLGLTLVDSLVLAATIGSIGSGANLNALLSAMAAMLVVVFAVIVLSIIALAFYLVGFGFLYGGRDEFGPAHAQDMRISLFTLIGAFVVQLVGFFVTLVLEFRAMGGMFGGGGISMGAIYAAELVGIGTGVAVAALVAATILFSVRALARPEHQTMLIIAAAVGILTPVVLGALALWLMPGLLSLGGVVTTDVTIGVPSLVGSALGFVTFALFLVAHRGAAERIRSGELPPVTPPPASAPWIPGPMVPPYPYPMPVAPPLPPAQPPARP